MKYLISLSWHGFATVEVKAAHMDRAIEKALKLANEEIEIPELDIEVTSAREAR